jgi:hypothetical protein
MPTRRIGGFRGAVALIAAATALGACSDDGDATTTSTRPSDDGGEVTTTDVVSDEAAAFAAAFRLAAGRTGLEDFSSVDAELTEFSLDAATEVCDAIGSGESAPEAIGDAVEEFTANFESDFGLPAADLGGGWRDATFNTAAEVLCPESATDIINVLSAGGSGD